MFKIIDTVLTCIENYITGILLLGSLIILGVNIVLRYAFDASSTWVEEAVRYAIIWVTFIGGSQCVKHGVHVGIDIVVEMMPQKSRKFFYAIAQFLSAFFCACCTVFGYQITQMVIENGQRSPAMLMPMWIVYISIPLGFLLMTIRFIIAGIQALQNRNNPSSALVTDESGEIDMSRL